MKVIDATYSACTIGTLKKTKQLWTNELTKSHNLQKGMRNVMCHLNLKARKGIHEGGKGKKVQI